MSHLPNSEARFMNANLQRSIPAVIASFCIGSYLSDDEACKWASCSRTSLAQLQEYKFKRSSTMTRMRSLASSAGHLLAFGRISHVIIETAEQWVEALPSLPSHVRSVTICILQKELQALYPPTEEDCVRSSLCCDRRNVLERSLSKELFEGTPIPNPNVLLPPTVEELFIQTSAPEFERWLRHLRFSPHSCLRILRLAKLGSQWTTLPPFVRDSLPDTLVELALPVMTYLDPYLQSLHLQPSLECYPIHWPPNLTKLSIDCHPSSAFACHPTEFPGFPSTLTELHGIEYAEGPTVREMINRLPSSIQYLSLLRKVLSIDGTWKFPNTLLSLTLEHLKQIDVSPEMPPFTFPCSLTELNLLAFEQPELLNSILPPSLTSMMVVVGDDTERAFESMIWPPHLHTLRVGAYKKPASLRYWTPPSQLTKLYLGFWNVPLDGVPLPNTLRSLIFYYYTQSLAQVIFPASLETIEFRGVAPPLQRDCWNPPVNLTSLRVSQFQRGIHFPPSLLQFKTSKNPNFFHPCSLLQELGASLPPGLLELDLRGIQHDPCCQPLDTLPWPPRLQRFHLAASPHEPWNLLRFPSAPLIPPTLREFWVYMDRFSPPTTSAKLRQEMTEWASKALPFDCALLFVPGQ